MSRTDDGTDIIVDIDVVIGVEFDVGADTGFSVDTAVVIGWVVQPVCVTTFSHFLFHFF